MTPDGHAPAALTSTSMHSQLDLGLVCQGSAMTPDIHAPITVIASTATRTSTPDSFVRGQL
jgi:hypothetical protein